MPGFAGFWGVLPGFAFAFVFWAPGCGLVLPGFAFAFVFWAPGGGLLGSGLLWALRTGDWVVLIEVYCFSPGAGFDRAVC